MWLLIFFLTPIVEMYLLIEVGGYIGAWPTIGLVMITAVIGVGLLRVQGLATLTRGMSRLEGGELPAREVVEGLLLAVAGALLLTPGFVTDTVGFVLLTPILRGRIAEQVLARVQVVPPPGTGPGPDGRSGPFQTGRSGSGFPGDRGPGGSGVFEGEFETLDEPESGPASDPSGSSNPIDRQKPPPGA
jgi:UPF0716 protein FxsA